MTSTNTLSAANRVNIPAVCRIPGRGTAVVVSPGILLSTKTVFGSKADCKRLQAVFFESGKKGTVEVSLLPDQYYFSSVYPEYLDYCLVACETKGIFGVNPVKLPLCRSEWQQVREGDTVLVIQHPLYDANEQGTVEAPPTDVVSPLSPGGPAEQLSELKRFEEVLRRRDDVLTLKTHGRHRTYGCPCFNDNAELVGLQSQYEDPADGLVSRAVSIVTIVKHMFANVQLSKIKQTPLFEDVWSTWYVQNDTTRIVSIMSNFKQTEIQRKSAERLCEHTSQRELLEGVVACGGTKVIVESIQQFMDDEELVALGFRSLWNISFTEEDNRRHIVEANGVNVILEALTKYSTVENIAQFGTVVLFNLTLSQSTLQGNTTTSDAAEDINNSWVSRGQRVVLDTMIQFAGVEVIQKFGIGFFVNACKYRPEYGQQVISWGGVDHIAEIAKNKLNNEYLMENIVAFVALVAGHSVRTGTSASQASAGVTTTSHALSSTTAPPVSESYSATPAGGNGFEVRQHPSLAQMIGPILETAHRYPSNGGLQRSVSSALWSLGNDAGLRVALLSHPLGLEVLRTSIGSVSSVREL